MQCLNCEKRDAVYGMKGLCRKCHAIPAVRAKYPKLPSTKPCNTTGTAEPTMEQLDALIAEQMESLPEWWDKDYRSQARESGYAAPSPSRRN